MRSCGNQLGTSGLEGPKKLRILYGNDKKKTDYGLGLEGAEDGTEGGAEDGICCGGGAADGGAEDGPCCCCIEEALCMCNTGGPPPEFVNPEGGATTTWATVGGASTR